jgi:hypothetical protein
MNHDNTLKVTVTTPHKIKTSLLTSSSDFCLSSVFARILCSVGQFSPWGRIWLNCMEITSFNSRVLAFLAVTVFWPVRCRVNSLYLSAGMETFLYALPRNRLISTQCIASSVTFVAVETWLPSCCLAMGTWLCLHYCGFQASCHNTIGKLPAYDITHW